MTIRISISCEPNEIDDVRRLLMGFVVGGLKQQAELFDDNGHLSDVAENDILRRYDSGDTIRDIAADLGIDGRRIAGFVLGKRRSPNCQGAKP